MKKILFILLLLFPFIVKASTDVKITSIEEKDRQGYVEVNSEPTFKDLNISFDLNFNVPNDKILYDVTIKNDSKKDYEIDTGKAFTEGEFIEYNVSFDNDNKIIKAGETKHLTITITYVKEVPEDKLVDGKYTEKNDMQINLSNEEPNPVTSTGAPILLFALSLVFGLILILCYKNSKNLLYIFTLILLIPVTVLAIERLTLDVSTQIEINPPVRKFKIRYSLPSTNCNSVNEELTIEKGMTWNDFFDTNDSNSSELIYESFDMGVHFVFVDRRVNLCSNPSYVSNHNFEDREQCRESYIDRDINLTDEIKSSTFGYYETSTCK